MVLEEVRTSKSSPLINAFLTFLFLSYSKRIVVSLKLLHMTSTFSINGTSISPSLEFEPNVTYFGCQHVLLGLFAVILIIVFTLPPVLLLVLYPTRLFQKSLQCSSNEQTTWTQETAEQVRQARRPPDQCLVGGAPCGKLRLE